MGQFAKRASARPRWVPGEHVTWEGWEDSAVPPDKVGAYLRDLQASCTTSIGYMARSMATSARAAFTRASHLISKAPEGIRNYRSFMEEATDLVVSYGGSISGEHGDGQSKAEFLDKMFGEELIQAFREFKSIWDPDWKMNPGKVVDPYRIDENLRLGADYGQLQPSYAFSFPAGRRQFQPGHAPLRGRGRMPAPSEGHHVPELPRHHGRDAFYARPCTRAV